MTLSAQLDGARPDAPSSGMRNSRRVVLESLLVSQYPDPPISNRVTPFLEPFLQPGSEHVHYLNIHFLRFFESQTLLSL